MFGESSRRGTVSLVAAVRRQQCEFDQVKLAGLTVRKSCKAGSAALEMRRYGFGAADFSALGHVIDGPADSGACAEAWLR